MDEETGENRLGKHMHRCVRCGQVAAALSVVFLIRRLRKRQEQPPKHHRFPIFGH